MRVGSVFGYFKADSTFFVRNNRVLEPIKMTLKLKR